MIAAMSLNHSEVGIKSSLFIELDRGTRYYCEVRQCDSDPFTTADG